MPLGVISTVLDSAREVAEVKKRVINTTGGQGSLFKGGNTPIEVLKERHFRQREQPVQRHEAAYLGQYVENDWHRGMLYKADVGIQSQQLA